MDRLRLAGAVLLVSLAIAGCRGDDDAAAPADTTGPTSSAEHSPTTDPPNTGGIDVPDLPGTFSAAIPSLGFGIAVPDGWQATVLSDEAIDRLEAAALSQPSFVDAARTVAESGAVFYAAGIDDQGRVSELKVDVQNGADSSPAGVAALANTVAESGKVQDVTVVDDLDDGRIRVDYRLAAPDDAEEVHGPIDTIGSQLFVPDGERVWSFIVTSEDSASQDALLAILEASVTF